MSNVCVTVRIAEQSFQLWLQPFLMINTKRLYLFMVKQFLYDVFIAHLIKELCSYRRSLACHFWQMHNIAA